MDQKKTDSKTVEETDAEKKTTETHTESGKPAVEKTETTVEKKD